MRPTVVALAVTAVVGLSACGSGGDGTTSTSATPGPGAASAATTRVTGTGYAVALPGRGWSDQRSVLPEGQRAQFDRVFTQGGASAERPIVQTLRERASAAEANAPEALPTLEAGFRRGLASGGGKAGRADRTTLGGEPAIVLPASGAAATGGTYYGRTFLTVHDDVAIVVSVVSQSGDRAAVDRLTDAVRRGWRWTP